MFFLNDCITEALILRVTMFSFFAVGYTDFRFIES